MKRFDKRTYPKSIYNDYINGTDLMLPTLLQNRVSFDDVKNILRLTVDVSYDCELEQYPELEDMRELSEEELYAQKNEIGGFAYLYKERFAFDFTEQQQFCGNLKRSNYLSGASISYSLGEGLFDFCYADFDFQKGEQHFLDGVGRLSTLPQTHTEIEELSRRIDFMKTMAVISPLAYSSIYTAAFPPLLKELTVEAFDDYIGYLKLLQREFLSLLEFCFDESFYPEVLGGKLPLERFGIYCDIFDRPTLWTSTEQLFVTINHADQRNLKKIALTKQHKEFAEAFGVDLRTLETLCAIPHSGEISYQCSSLLSMLQLEFSKLMESGLRLRKCQYCGKYFILKGNYNGQNCDRITENNMTCQQLAAAKKHKEKTANKVPWKIYNKYYKRYFARNKVGTISDNDFKRWQYRATAMRDECLETTTQTEDFLVWAHESFDNRPFKKPVKEVLADFSK
ncbi:MAG: DUF6076 domain-containing protein [Oscillospiraceae bacterium]